MRATCNHCTADVTNGLALCQRCQHTLSVSLVNIASYAADVAAIQPGERIKAKSAYRSTPPPGTEPARDHISDELNHVGAIIVGWCRNLADDRPVDAPPRETGLQCAWLEQHVASIATLQWAHECLREVMDCERRLKRVLDKADTGKYAGICGAFVGTLTNGDAVHCPRELFLVADATWVRCPECGTQHDAAQRREVMKAEAREELVPVRVLAQVIVGLEDKQVSVEQLTRRVENWIARPKDNPRLTSRGTRVIDGRPRKVYRIGDVLDLLEDDTRRNKREEAAA